MYYITKITEENLMTLCKIKKYADDISDIYKDIINIESAITHDHCKEMGLRCRKRNDRKEFGSHNWEWYLDKGIKSAINEGQEVKIITIGELIKILFEDNVPDDLKNSIITHKDIIERLK